MNRDIYINNENNNIFSIETNWEILIYNEIQLIFYNIKKIYIYKAIIINNNL